MITNKISQYSSQSSLSSCTDFSSADPLSIHKQFVILGRERNKITYKLLSLLPKINQLKIYEAHGYATIFEYAGKLAGLSNSVVRKALNLEEKLKDKPYLQKSVETQGIHKVALVAAIATPENEKMFAEKVENMSKSALQEYSKEIRGKIPTSWNIEMDEEMMVMFLKLKKEIGEGLSNKEAMRRLLKDMMAKNIKPQDRRETSVASEASISKLFKKDSINKISDIHSQEIDIVKKKPENLSHRASNKAKENDTLVSQLISKIHKQIITKINNQYSIKITRYIPVSIKRQVLASTRERCAHPNCPNPARIFHHQVRFSQTKSHDSLIPLCKIHHEFAHNDITEAKTEADVLYRKYRQAALL